MKKPKLDFKIMFHVPGWGSEIIEGWGTPFEYKQSLSHNKNTFLFYPLNGDGVPYIIYQGDIFENHNQACIRLDREKLDHKKWLEKTRDECIVKLEELKP